MICSNFKGVTVIQTEKIWCSNSAVDFCLEAIRFITRPKQQLSWQLFCSFLESFQVNSNILFPSGLCDFAFPYKPFTFGVHFTINPCSLNIWYDTIWYDMIWYDMIWYDVMWCGMIWYGMVWYDRIWYGIWYIIYMIWYGDSIEELLEWKK